MTVDERLEHVEAKRPLVFDDIDFTIRDPEGLRAVLAAPLEYAQRVEAVVSTDGMQALMPRREPRIDRFLELWTIDEHGHGRALGELMRRLHLEPTAVGEADYGVQNRLIGALGRASEAMHDVVTVVWATCGAMNEHLAMAAYARMDAILRERGEWALHETLFRWLRAHESAHKSFYAAYSAETWARLAPWQRRFARWTVRTTWAPVGAGAKSDKPAFGRTVVALGPDDWEESIAAPVQSVADRLVAEGEPADPFVRRAILECLEAEAALGRAA